MQPAVRKVKNSKRYLLKEVNAHGVRLRDLGVLSQIAAKPGVTYTLLDADSLLPVEGVVGKRKKTVLELFVDDEKVGELIDFFGHQPVTLTDASVTPYEPLAFFEPVNRLSIELTDTAEQGGLLTGLDLGGLTVPALGLGGLLLSSAKSGSSSTVSAATTAASGSGAATLLGSLKGLVMAGPVMAGSIVVKAYDTSGHELGSTTVGADGSWEIKDARLYAYTGPVLVKAFDANGSAANYLDEVSGSGKTLTGDLRALAVLDGKTIPQINITPVTELAVRTTGINSDIAPTAEEVQKAIALIKAALNVSFDPVSTIPVATNTSGFNTDGNSILTDGEKYGILLAKLSGADSVNNGDMGVTLASLETQVTLAASSGEYGGVQAILEEGRKAALDALKGAPASSEKTFLVDTAMARYLLGDVVVNSQAVSQSGALTVSGTALPNSTVSLLLPSGEQVTAKTDASGAFVATSKTAQTVGTITAQSQDVLGAPVSKDVTLDTIAPSIVEITPNDLSIDVAIDESIVIKFSEAVVRGSGTLYLRKNSSTGSIVESFDMETSDRLNLIGNSLAITPSSDLEAGTRYFLTGKSGGVIGAITDASGNALQPQAQVYSFTTVPEDAGPGSSDPVTVSVSASKTSLSAGESLGVLFTLSEPSNDFTIGDISVLGGVIEQFVKLTETVYTALFTPSTGVAAAFISIDSNRFRNSAGVWNIDGSDLDNSLVLSVQPGSGSSGADVMPPYASQFNPLSGATQVPVDSNIYLGFSEAIKRGLGLVQIRQATASGPIVESFDIATSSRVTVSGNALIIDPTASLAEGMRYFVSVAPGAITDLAGNLFGGTSSYEFTTANTVIDVTPPTVATFNPVDGAAGAPVSGGIVLTFDEPIMRGTGLIQVRQISATGPVVESFDVAASGRVLIAEQSLTVLPSAPLAAGTHYFVTVGSGVVTDTSANPFAGTVTYDFTTAAIGDSVAPVVSVFRPADGSLNATADGNITLTFSEPVAAGAGLIQIRQGSATGPVVESLDVVTSSRITIDGTVVTVDPTALLAEGGHYFVTVAPGAIRDLTGNAYAGTTVYDFTVESVPKIIKISSDMADRLLLEGDVISIDVDFDQEVMVNPTGVGPVLAMNSGGLAHYQSGSGTSRLTFTYVVGVNDEATLLNVNAFALNDAFVGNAGGARINDAVDALPGGNLGINNAFVVDANPPDIIGMTNDVSLDASGVANGLISVYFDQPVLVSGLSAGQNEALLGLVGITSVISEEIVPPATLDMSLLDRPSNVLYFRYSGIPAFGDPAEIDVQAFASNNRIITDSAGNRANLTVTAENNIFGTTPEEIFTVLPAAGPFGDSPLFIRLYDGLGEVLYEAHASSDNLRFTALEARDSSIGWRIVEIYDGDSSTTEYLDEYSGVEKSLAAGDSGFFLRTYVHTGLLQDLVVSPLTELATRLALKAGDGLLNEHAGHVADAVSRMFGVDSILTTPVAFTNSSSYRPADGIDASEKYGEVLALLSAADAITGSMSLTLDFLSQHISYQPQSGVLVTDAQEALELLLLDAAGMSGYTGVIGLPEVAPVSLSATTVSGNFGDDMSGSGVLVLADTGETCWELVDATDSGAFQLAVSSGSGGGVEPEMVVMPASPMVVELADGEPPYLPIVH